MFISEPRQFSNWSLKLGNFLEGILGGMKEAFEWAQDQDITIVEATPVGAHQMQAVMPRTLGVSCTRCWLNCANAKLSA